MHTVLKNDATISKLSKRTYDNLDTQFSCNGTVNKSMGHTICFAPALKTNHIRMDNHYCIKFFKTARERTNWEHYDNLCYFSEENIHKYMSYIKEVVDCFEYELDSSSDDYYILKIHINALHFYHTFIITGIRYLYEKNYAVALGEAMALKNSYFFKNENIYSLIGLVISSNAGIKARMSNDMSHFYVKSMLQFKPISTEELKKRINSYAEDTGVVEDEYDMIKIRNVTSLWDYVKIGDEITDAGVSLSGNVAETLFDTFFAKRYIIYRKNYKNIVKTPELTKSQILDEFGYSNNKYFDYSFYDEED